ncbi:MAG: hypothetical protein ACR2FY_21585 [Pirellulaceae bacterium]
MVVLPQQSSGRPHSRSTLKYLHAGGALVWNALPRSREVVAFTPDGLSHTFSENDVLQDEKVLPGFRCAVAELFR